MQGCIIRFCPATVKNIFLLFYIFNNSFHFFIPLSQELDSLKRLFLSLHWDWSNTNGKCQNKEKILSFIFLYIVWSRAVPNLHHKSLCGPNIILKSIQHNVSRMDCYESTKTLSILKKALFIFYFWDNEGLKSLFTEVIKGHCVWSVKTCTLFSRCDMIRHLLTAPIHLHSRFHNTGVHYRETSRALGHWEDKFLQANLRLFESGCPLWR